MKVAVLGATGPTGQQLVKEALARGHQVVALVRSPEKITEKHDKLEVHKVDVFQSGELSPHLQGCDAVLSALGRNGLTLPFTTLTFYEDSIQPIVTAMREANVLRFVCMTSWCTEYQPDNPKFIEWFIKPLLLGRHLSSMARMEKYLLGECSDINYTVVRPPQLTNGASSDNEMNAVQGQFVPGRSVSVARVDVAKFMLDCLANDQWSRKVVAIAPK